MVERELVGRRLRAESQISGGGLKITTTFDKAAQNAAVKAAQRNTRQAADAADKKASDLHAAVASVEVGTGEVLALYGGPDFVENSRNWATTAAADRVDVQDVRAGRRAGRRLQPALHVQRQHLHPARATRTTVRNEFSNQYGSNVTLLQGHRRLDQHRLRRPDHRR